MNKLELAHEFIKYKLEQEELRQATCNEDSDDFSFHEKEMMQYEIVLNYLELIESLQKKKKI